VLLHLGAPLDGLVAAFGRDFVGAGERPEQARAEALRDLGTGCQILVDLGLSELRLMSSSTAPILGLEAYGLTIVERVGIRPGGVRR
jgi:GTP cyclohydrolase II